MEAMKARGSVGQKSQMKNPRKIHHHHTHPFIPTHTENFAPPNFNTIGILQTPPPFLSHSYPTPYSLRQPPLLPLPAANHRLIPAAVKKPNGGSNYRARQDSSLTPKKSKLPTAKSAIGSPKPGLLGPDPMDLTNNNKNKVVVFNEKPVISSSGNMVDLFAISPPPSSLPLPTFPLRPKMSCRGVAGIDDGATDDLRRLLRLR